jgi:hypothetical protein
MYGHLVPSSGGKALPLRKTRMFLGRVKGSDAPLSRENAYCQLELIEGFWHIEDLNTPQGVKVNGRTCKRQRLMPDDEIALGRHRYRISFEAPRYAGVGRLAKNQRPHRPAPPSAKTETMDVPTAPPASGVLGRLVPIGGGEMILLKKPRVTIGRRTPCDIILDRRSVSGMHCGLEFVNGYWRIRDLDSRNGIRVDSVKVKSAWILPKGRLSIADHRFQLEYTATGEPPAEALAQQQQRRERDATSDQRSFMEKLGLTERDLERARFEEYDEQDTQRRRWNVLEND